MNFAINSELQLVSIFLLSKNYVKNDEAINLKSSFYFTESQIKFLIACTLKHYLPFSGHKIHNKSSKAAQ